MIEMIFKTNETLSGVCLQANSLSCIQRVCDAVQSHPTWNVAHLAVSLALTDCLNNEEILR